MTVAPPRAAHPWLDRLLTPDWRELHKFWSVQLSVFWAIVCGLWVSVSAVQNFVSPIHFVEICCVMSVVILFARSTNQPGLTV